MLNKSQAIKLSVSTAAFLAVIKVIVGFFTGSMMIIASAVDSILDIFSSTINYIAIRKAEEPPDEGHSYGHHKFEPMAAFVQSIVILVSGAFIIFRAVDKIIDNDNIVVYGPAVVVMLVSVVLTGGLVFVLRATAKRERSAVLKADALHYEVDLLSGAGILVALVVIKYTGLGIIDSVISIIIALYILVSAVRLMLESSGDLLDKDISDEEKRIVKEILEQKQDYLLDYHELKTRKAGAKSFVELHITVCRSISVGEAHTIADSIENMIKEKIEGAEAIVHIDPCLEKDCSGENDVYCAANNEIKLENITDNKGGH